jgi:hypothetical protein
MVWAEVKWLLERSGYGRICSASMPPKEKPLNLAEQRLFLEAGGESGIRQKRRKTK